MEQRDEEELDSHPPRTVPCKGCGRETVYISALCGNDHCKLEGQTMLNTLDRADLAEKIVMMFRDLPTSDTQLKLWREQAEAAVDAVLKKLETYRPRDWLIHLIGVGLKAHGMEGREVKTQSVPNRRYSWIAFCEQTYFSGCGTNENQALADLLRMVLMDAGVDGE